MSELVKKEVGTQVIQRVENLMQTGFTMPSDYNHVNAIKASMLVLNEMRDKTEKQVLALCSPASVQSALFEMVTKGLDVSKKQGYFIKRGDKMCFHESYFGKITQVKRIFPDFDPNPRVIYQGDVFEYSTDPSTGRRTLVKHEQKLENLDNDFVGAYMYVPCSNGGQDLYIMTKKQIIAAWSKSSDSNQTTHKLFTDKMASKTIVSSACTMIINSTPSASVGYGQNDADYTEYQSDDVEEVEMAEEVIQTQDVQAQQIEQAPQETTDF